MVGREVDLLASEDQAQDLLPYERLLGDALRGDAGLFAREDAIEAEWRIVDSGAEPRHGAAGVRAGLLGTVGGRSARRQHPRRLAQAGRSDPRALTRVAAIVRARVRIMPPCA
jgi:hypothetical protein